MFEIKPKKFKRVLVGVDDAPDACAAFSYAIDKAKHDGSELGIVSILEADRVGVYQILDKDYVRSSEDESRQRVNEYVRAATDYDADPGKIAAVANHGEWPAKRTCNHVIPAFQPDLLVVGSIGKKSSCKAVGSQASYTAHHVGTLVFVIRTNAVQAYE